MKWIMAFLCVVMATPAFAQIRADNYDAWSLLCGDKGNCSLSQIVAKDPQGKQILLGVNINYSLSDDFPVLLLRLPASIRESAGLGIKIDEHDAVQVPLSQCNNKACQAVIKMDKIIIEQMQEGQVMRVAYADDKQQQQTLPVSLSKFPLAWQALQEAHSRNLNNRS